MTKDQCGSMSEGSGTTKDGMMKRTEVINPNPIMTTLTHWADHLETCITFLLSRPTITDIKSSFCLFGCVCVLLGELG